MAKLRSSSYDLNVQIVSRYRVRVTLHCHLRHRPIASIIHRYLQSPSQLTHVPKPQHQHQTHNAISTKTPAYALVPSTSPPLNDLLAPNLMVALPIAAPPPKRRPRSLRKAATAIHRRIQYSTSRPFTLCHTLTLRPTRADKPIPSV